MWELGCNCKNKLITYQIINNSIFVIPKSGVLKTENIISDVFFLLKNDNTSNRIRASNIYFIFFGGGGE